MSFFLLAPNSPSNNSLLTSTFSEPYNNSNGKSTPFAHSIPVSRTDVRHKNEVEVELKPPQQQQQQQQQQPQIRNTFHNNVSPMSAVSYPPVVRPIGITNNRVPAMFLDENTPSQHYQTPKRRILTNSVQTQTFNQNDQYLQQLKALNEETVVKNEKIHILLRELTDCQVNIS